MGAAMTKTKQNFTVHYVEESQSKKVEFNMIPLLAFLRNNCDDIEGIYSDNPKVDVMALLEELDSIRRAVAHDDSKPKVGAELLSYLEAENLIIMSEASNMIAAGRISFRHLRAVLKPELEIIVRGTHNQGGRVLGTSYRQSFFGTYLEIEYEYISSNGNSYMTCREDAAIFAYEGLKDIDKLEVKPISAEEKNALDQRGRAYENVALGSHYRDYAGHMDVMGWRGYYPIRSVGRIMVDISTYDQFKSNRRRGEETSQKTLHDSQYWMADAHVWGFSLSTKQWGRFQVETVSEIDFRKNAFDQLVMPAEKKQLVKALVSDNNRGFADIISGKGGGCIFLLHGVPGVGKTLTAEAIAELLERPLYSVSVGELGTDTAQLEKSLRQILDVAQVWNAVILIDEADIFLEKRSVGDILRNAMVSVFLRLLEYHQGVLFLTTNRVTEFDPAFHSRISVGMHYGPLTADARLQIWHNLLDSAGISGVDVAALSSHPLNGRQIKNTIRLAQGLARQAGEAVNDDHFLQCFEVGHQFNHDFAKM